jgi:hypothetical protein
MRWLMLVFLVSFAAMIFACAGIAWHIWRQHAKTKTLPSGPGNTNIQVPEETAFEPEEAP